jgi:hypothetical protein
MTPPHYRNYKLIMSVTLRSLVFTVILGLALPLAADQLLTFTAERKTFNSQLEFFPQEPGRERNLEAEAAFEGSMLLSENAVRTDGERDSWIFLANEKKLLRLHHHDQTYQEYDLPIQLDKILDEKEKKATARRITNAQGEITVKESEKTNKVGPWSARKFILQFQPINTELGVTTVETWQSTELEINLALYNALRQARITALPWTKNWQEAEMALPGVSVLWRVERVQEHRRWIRSRKVLKIEEVPHAPEAFRPPAGYRRL